jgi:hypothetical protein
LRWSTRHEEEAEAREGRKEVLMPAGRPSKYDPAFCEVVEDTMRAGLFQDGRRRKCWAFATTRSRTWMAEHPEFLIAVRRGEAKRTQILETNLLAAETGPQVTSRIFALKNAAPDEWRDRQAVEHSGPNGGPIQTEATSPADRLKARLDEIAGRATGDTAGE